MMANPLDQVRRRKTERTYREGGWGPAQTRQLPRSDGKPLVLQIRLPAAMELVDLPSLARQARGAPAVVAQGAAELEQLAGPAGLVVVGALRPSRVREADREILATMTVAFSEIEEPLEAADFLVPDSERTVKADVDVTRLSDRATLIRRLSLESPGEGLEPVLVLLMQYLLQTRYGALVVAFSTTNQEMMGHWGRTLYRRIVETMFIGEQPVPD
jgi:hypothetical protein